MQSQTSFYFSISTFHFILYYIITKFIIFFILDLCLKLKYFRKKQTKGSTLFFFYANLAKLLVKEKEGINRKGNYFLRKR